MKIGLIGLGYWGKIILKNLVNLGYRDFVICEKNEVDWNQFGTKYNLVKSYKDVECDVAFVITETTTHYDICKSFLSRGIDVFCEKPLTLDYESSLQLYEEAAKSNSRLFVDWVFTYNPCVEIISELIKKKGKPKNIIANRLNYGPIRNDDDARWDLASHDVSIARYLLNENPHRVDWLNFKRNPNSIQNDSAVGILSFENTSVQINVSWEYGKKDRLYSIEFDDGFVYWDDNDKTVTSNFKQLAVPDYSPLHKSIGCFLNGDYDKTKQQNLTLDTIRILQHENSF